MSLSPGTRISTYDVVAPIGEGGMGVVYRAHDTKLGRDIALKVLPEAFALDTERLARFEREARTLATLNHPNIAQVYDAGKDSSGAYLVMELVEGETLSEAIRERHSSAPSSSASSPGDLLEWALPIAKQIVDALEAAHEQGIIHRDLKPANIKVRPDGAVKVLDFGLAKAMDSSGAANPNAGAEPGRSVSHSPTLTHQGTMAGMILGTAAYMSPEQARGRVVDRRADIWAFGVVLYEMLAGRRAFEGEDVSITLASVLKEDVNWKALPEDLPASWRRLLRRCLEKDPKRRLSAIADARLDLDEVVTPGADAGTSSGAKDAERTGELVAAHAELRRMSKKQKLAAGVASLMGVVALAALFWPRPQPAPPLRVALSLEFPALTRGSFDPAVSPDGQRLAYVSPREPGGPGVIFVRPLGGEEARPLAGTDGAGQLKWAPDSRSLAFVANGRVHVAQESGGLRRLAEVPDVAGLTWLPEGDVLAASNSYSGTGKLLRVPVQGGAAAELAMPRLDGPAGGFSFPQVLPDGRRFLYLGWSLDADQRALFVGSLDGADGTAPVRIIASEAAGTFADGHLFLVRDGALFAQPFDPYALRLSGEPVRLADDLSVSFARAAYAVSEAGVLVYHQSASGLGSDLAWFDRAGRALGTAGDGGNIFQFRLSPDGRRVALVEFRTGHPSRLSVLDLSNGISSPVNTANDSTYGPVWSPDSQTIAYRAAQNGSVQLFTQEIGGPVARLAYESAGPVKWLSDWSADGQWLLFHLSRPSKLYSVKPGDPSSLKLLLDTPERMDGAHFSPDGKWIAYQITEGGVFNVSVASFPAFDQRRQVSRQGGGQAMWRGDGRELFYLTPGGKMMSVRATPTATGGLEISAPAELFQTPLTGPNLVIDQYSVTADGQRFLILRPRGSTAASATVHVVVNWRGR